MTTSVPALMLALLYEGRCRRMDEPPQLLPHEVKLRLSAILRDGRVTFTAHCRAEMTEANATIDDVLNVLEHGQPSEAAEWDEKHSNWKYRIIGADIEGNALTAITIIIEAHLLARVITVF